MRGDRSLAVIDPASTAYWTAVTLAAYQRRNSRGVAIMTKCQVLHDFIQARTALPVPGVYDAFSARLVEQAGFLACQVSGFAVAAAALGLPDIGILSMRDQIAAVQCIAAAVHGGRDGHALRPDRAGRDDVPLASPHRACSGKRAGRREGGLAKPAHGAGREVRPRDQLGRGRVDATNLLGNDAGPHGGRHGNRPTQPPPRTMRRASAW